MLEAAGDAPSPRPAKRLPDRADETEGHPRPLLALGRDCEYGRADRRVGGGPRDRSPLGGVDSHNREVAVGIDTPDLPGERLPVAEGDGRLRTPEVVGVGEHQAVGHDDAGAPPASRADADHRGRHLVDDHGRRLLQLLENCHVGLLDSDLRCASEYHCSG